VLLRGRDSTPRIVMALSRARPRSRYAPLPMDQIPPVVGLRSPGSEPSTLPAIFPMELPETRRCASVVASSSGGSCTLGHVEVVEGLTLSRAEPFVQHRGEGRWLRIGAQLLGRHAEEQGGGERLGQTQREVRGLGREVGEALATLSSDSRPWDWGCQPRSPRAHMPADRARGAHPEPGSRLAVRSIGPPRLRSPACEDQATTLHSGMPVARRRAACIKSTATSFPEPFNRLEICSRSGVVRRF